MFAEMTNLPSINMSSVVQSIGSHLICDSICDYWKIMLYAGKKKDPIESRTSWIRLTTPSWGFSAIWNVLKLPWRKRETDIGLVNKAWNLCMILILTFFECFAVGARSSTVAFPPRCPAFSVYLHVRAVFITPGENKTRIIAFGIW